MKHVTLLQIVFTSLAIFSGNIFWVLFDKALLDQKLLTTSVIVLALGLLLPIITFALYLSMQVCVVLLCTKKVLIILISVLSNLLYISILGVSTQHVIGELIIAAAIVLFSLQFQNQTQFFGKKFFYLGSFTSSLSLSLVVISTVIAVNFYTLFGQALSQQNYLVPNSVITKDLLPLYKIYEDDLNVKNGNELFGSYITRRSARSKLSRKYIRARTLAILRLPATTSDKQTMYTLIDTSLQKTVLFIIYRFKQLVPLVVSLGLGVISQVLFTISSYLAGIVSLLIIKILLYDKYLKNVEQNLNYNRIVKN